MSADGEPSTTSSRSCRSRPSAAVERLGPLVGRGGPPPTRAGRSGLIHASIDLDRVQPPTPNSSALRPATERSRPSGQYHAFAHGGRGHDTNSHHDVGNRDADTTGTRAPRRTVVCRHHDARRSATPPAVGDRARTRDGAALPLCAVLARSGSQPGGRRDRGQRLRRRDAAHAARGEPVERGGWTPADRHAADAGAVPAIAAARRRLVRGLVAPVRDGSPRDLPEDRAAVGAVRGSGERRATRRSDSSTTRSSAGWATSARDSARRTSSVAIRSVRCRPRTVGAGQVTAVDSLATALTALRRDRRPG